MIRYNKNPTDEHNNTKPTCDETVSDSDTKMWGFEYKWYMTGYRIQRYVLVYFGALTKTLTILQYMCGIKILFFI